MKFTLLLGLVAGPHIALAQAAQEPSKSPDGIQKINVAEAIEKAQADGSVSMVFVERLGAAHAAVLPEQSRRDATPDNEWRNVLCQKRARSHAASVLLSTDATPRVSAPLKAQTVSLVS